MKIFKMSAVFFAFLLFLSAESFARTYDFTTLYNQFMVGEILKNKISDESLWALHDYTNVDETFYVDINSYLRAKTVLGSVAPTYPTPFEAVKFPENIRFENFSQQEIYEKIMGLDKIFLELPDLPRDITLFRGISLDWRKGRPFEVGEEYEDAAYISSSMKQTYAETFTYSNSGALLVLYFEKPLRGLLLKNFEEEVLIERGQRFKIMKKKQRIGKPDLYLTQVCHKGQCSKKLSQEDQLALFELLD